MYSLIHHDDLTLSSGLVNASLTRRQLRIYDATGSLVHSVNIPQTVHGNPQIITWNGRDDLGRRLPT
jgi:hypothetical protein